MTNDKDNINVLDELNKGACMGMDSIHFILNKVTDKRLKKELNTQYEKYKTISEKINKIYAKYNKNETPHETNTMNKVMTWSGIEMKTFNDETTSKIAELLVQGTNMGIIEGRRILNNKKVKDEIKDLVQEYVDMQEDAVEKLKAFL